jgi:uncharacterized membrane protein
VFDLINGIPVHPLVVHAVVVLLPLAIVGTILIAARPRWRRAYGPLVVFFAAAATALMPVATSSGEALEERVGDPGKHAQLGDQLIWFSLPLLVLVVALVAIDRYYTPRAGSRSRTLTTTVAALAVVAALVSGVQVYRVGDSGAKSVWGGQVAAKQASN